MTWDRTWQDKAATAGIVLFAVDVSLFAFKCLLFRSLYGKHDNILIICSETGLIASVAAFIFILFDRRTLRRVILVIASLVLGYLFFNSVAWWVMVK
jgi:hypothetical protein